MHARDLTFAVNIWEFNIKPFSENSKKNYFKIFVVAKTSI